MCLLDGVTMCLIEIHESPAVLLRTLACCRDAHSAMWAEVSLLGGLTTWAAAYRHSHPHIWAPPPHLPAAQNSRGSILGCSTFLDTKPLPQQTHSIRELLHKCWMIARDPDFRSMALPARSSD